MENQKPYLVEKPSVVYFDVGIVPARSAQKVLGNLELLATNVPLPEKMRNSNSVMRTVGYHCNFPAVRYSVEDKKQGEKPGEVEVVYREFQINGKVITDFNSEEYSQLWGIGGVK